MNFIKIRTSFFFDWNGNLVLLLITYGHCLLTYFDLQLPHMGLVFS